MVAMFFLSPFHRPLRRAAQHTPFARRHWLVSAVLGLALATTACSGPTVPRSVTLPLDKMQHKLDERFPRSLALGGLLDVNLQTPHLRLLPEQNRINATMALQATGGALRTAHNGSIDVDFAVRYEPSDHTVRAHGLQVHAVQLDGLPPQAAQWLQRLGPQLAQQALREVTLYQLQPRDVALADSLGLQPGRMTVTPQGLVIELAPKPLP